jgi:hypothetical protein
MSAARTLCQSASYPASARSPRTRWSPPFFQRRAATFSTTRSAGRSRPTAATTWVHSPLRVPFSIPARRPAEEMSWQGNPAVSTSTGSTVVHSMRVMSPRLGTPGIRAARTWAMCGSGSAHQAMRPPPNAASTPRSRPPAPVHSDPITGPGDGTIRSVVSLVCGRLGPGVCRGRGVRLDRAGAVRCWVTLPSRPARRSGRGGAVRCRGTSG